MAVIHGQQIGKRLLGALGIPRNCRSFELRCAVDEVVTVRCEFAPEGDSAEIVESIAEYELQEKNSAPVQASSPDQAQAASPTPLARYASDSRQPKQGRDPAQTIRISVECDGLADLEARTARIHAQWVEIAEMQRAAGECADVAGCQAR